MSFRLIVLVACGEAEDAQVFDAAANHAKQRQGHVRMAPVYPDLAANLVYCGVVIAARAARNLLNFSAFRR